MNPKSSTTNINKKFYSITWADISKKPFPLEWYRELFNHHHYTMSAKAIDYWQDYRTSQYWTAQERKKYTDARITSIVNHAYNNFPFYRKLYDQHGIKLATIKTANDLKKLPLIDKSTLTLGLGKLAFNEEHNEQQSDKLLIRTSGSTGARMSFLCDKDQLDRRWAAWMRLFEWAGWRWGKKEFKFWYKEASTVKDPTVESFDAFLSNRHFYEFDHLNNEELAFFCQEIKEKKPFVITGYWEAIEAIARYAQTHKVVLPVKAIIPSTQVVPGNGRKLVSKVFKCKILDKYASAEFSGIGHQCNLTNLYHIQSENVYLEILKDGQRISKGLGEAIVTDLSNLSTPLIRYRIGDVLEATSEQCPCPISLPVFKKTHGRLKNVIKIGNRLLTELELAEWELAISSKNICERIKFSQTTPNQTLLMSSGISHIKKLQSAVKKLTGRSDTKIVSVDKIEHFKGKRHRGENEFTNHFNN